MHVFAALGQGLQSLRNKELYLGGFGRPSLRPPIVFFVVGAPILVLQKPDLDIDCPCCGSPSLWVVRFVVASRSIGTVFLGRRRCTRDPNGWTDLIRPGSYVSRETPAGREKHLNGVPDGRTAGANTRRPIDWQPTQVARADGTSAASDLIWEKGLRPPFRRTHCDLLENHGFLLTGSDAAGNWERS